MRVCEVRAAEYHVTSFLDIVLLMDQFNVCESSVLIIYFG